MKAISHTLLIAALATASSAFGANEQPEYTVLIEDGNVEIREYESLPLITAPLTKEDATKEKGAATTNNWDGARFGFMALFKYISGENTGKQKIAMTSPVIVNVSDKDAKMMSFVLPSEVAKKGAPAADSEHVRLDTMPGGKYATLRFKGFRSDEKNKKARESLEKWLQERNMKAIGKAFFAYYNPPWTPGLLRRNEVFIQVAEGSVAALRQ